MTKEEMKTRKEQIIEILKSWLQANDGTIFTDDFAISQITKEILALYHEQNLIVPTDDNLQTELDKLPYTQHLDDGGFNDGQMSGFEQGWREAIAWIKEHNA